MIVVQDELILNHQGGMTIFAESDTMISGTFSNLSGANQTLIYNTVSGFSLLETIRGDSFWPPTILITIGSLQKPTIWQQLHRANSSAVERITTQLTGNPGRHQSYNLGERIVDSNGLVSLDINSLQITELNTSIQSIPQDSDWIVNDYFGSNVESLPTVTNY